MGEGGGEIAPRPTMARSGHAGSTSCSPNHVRAQQQAEDLEAELLRLEQEHAEIVRPDARL